MKCEELQEAEGLLYDLTLLRPMESHWFLLVTGFQAGNQVARIYPCNKAGAWEGTFAVSSRPRVLI